MLDNNGLRYAAFALTALSLLAAGWLALQGRWSEASIMGGFVAAAVLFGVWRDRLPSLFTLIFAIAAAINALGYVLELWASPAWFDEAVHVATPFAVVTAVAWMLVKRQDAYPRTHPARYMFKIVIIGLAVGVLWEGFEWVIGIVGSARDTLSDLLMDMIGAVLAAIFCLAAARSEETELGK